MGRFLVGKGDRVVRTDTYLVRVEGHDGRVFEDLEPRRLFPFTAPDRFVTLMDSKENEQALINDMNALDEASRRAIEECFAEFYLIPEVTGIIHIDDKGGSFKWKVMTDRGAIEFHIRNRQSDIKQDGDILLIRDSNDNRYRIDLNKLDPKSMKKILSYV